MFILLLPIISIVHTVDGTEWPYLSSSAVKKLQYSYDCPYTIVVNIPLKIPGSGS